MSMSTEQVMLYTGGRRFVVDDDVVFAELNDEAILLNVTTGIYYGLNALGTEIWGLLAEGVGEDEINLRLFEEYDVTPAQLAADVNEFLS